MAMHVCVSCVRARHCIVYNGKMCKGKAYKDNVCKGKPSKGK
jgi:hypothetical protein